MGEEVKEYLRKVAPKQEKIVKIHTMVKMYLKRSE